MCRLIVERKKNENLDQIMYSEDFDGDAKDDEVEDSCEGEEEDVTGGMQRRRRSDCLRGQSPGKFPKMDICYTI